MGNSVYTEHYYLLLFNNYLGQNTKSLNVNPSILPLNLIALWMSQFVFVAQQIIHYLVYATKKQAFPSSGLNLICACKPI
jgi:hypothetical protein